MGEILCKEHISDIQRDTSAGWTLDREEVFDLCVSHEALRAEVEDYEQRGMGKLKPGEAIAQIGALVWNIGLYLMPDDGDEEGTYLEPPALKHYVKPGTRVALLGPAEKGGGK